MRYLRLLGVLVLIGASAQASKANSCSTFANLQNLLTAGSCTWTTSTGATESFDAFNLKSNDDGIGGQVSPSNWALTWIDTGVNLRMTFTPNAPTGITESTSGAQYRFELVYDVTETTAGMNGSGGLNSQTLGLTVGNINGSGSVAAVDTVKTNSGGSTLGAPAITFFSGPNSGTSTTNFAAQSGIQIDDSVTISSGVVVDPANLQSFYNQIGIKTAPEPGTLGMLASGLIALGALARRRAKGGQRFENSRG